MTNIVGGNAGKIPHFDQGSDGIAVNGAIKNKTSNFFDLMSIISESSLESGKNLSDSEQSAKQNELIFGKQYTQQQDVSSKELVTTQPKQSDLYLHQIMNVIGELQASKDLDTEKTITSSTFSQISGLLNAPEIALSATPSKPATGVFAVAILKALLRRFVISRFVKLTSS